MSTLREIIKTALSANWSLSTTPVFKEVMEIGHVESVIAASTNLVWIYQYEVSPVEHITPERYNPHYLIRIGVMSKTSDDLAENFRDEVKRILLSQIALTGVDVIKLLSQEDTSDWKKGIYSHKLLFDFYTLGEQGAGSITPTSTANANIYNQHYVTLQNDSAILPNSEHLGALTKNIVTSGSLTAVNITDTGSTNLAALNVSGSTALADLSVDSGVLYVDKTNNRVGVNDTTPSHALDVNGGIGIGGIEVITSGRVLQNVTADASIINTGTIDSARLPTITDAMVNDDITLTNITQITNRSHTNLQDIGSNTHAQIDSFISGHTKATHDALGINADTVDSYHAAQLRVTRFGTNSNSNVTLTASSTVTVLSLSVSYTAPCVIHVYGMMKWYGQATATTQHTVSLDNSSSTISNSVWTYGGYYDWYRSATVVGYESKSSGTGVVYRLRFQNHTASNGTSTNQCLFAEVIPT